MAKLCSQGMLDDLFYGYDFNTDLSLAQIFLNQLTDRRACYSAWL